MIQCVTEGVQVYFCGLVDPKRRRVPVLWGGCVCRWLGEKLRVIWLEVLSVEERFMGMRIYPMAASTT